LDEYAADLQRRPPHPELGPATLSVGRIEGGSSVNIVPDRCTIEIDRRLLPDQDPNDAHAEVERFLKGRPEITFDFENQPPWVISPGLGTERNADLVRLLQAAIRPIRGEPRTLG